VPASAGIFINKHFMQSLPPSFTLQEYIQYLPSQGNVGCCTASATLLSAEIIMATHGQKINLSRLYLYYMTRKLQNRLGLHGAELKETLNALSIYGVATDATWPFFYAWAEKEPNMRAIQDAARHKLYSYEWADSIDFKKHIVNHIPIIIGIGTGKMFWRLKGQFEKHAYVPINTTNNKQYKGHAVTIIGYDDNLNGGSWIIANSVGPKWGCRGYAAIPYSCNADIGESYIITNFAGIIAGKKIYEN